MSSRLSASCIRHFPYSNTPTLSGCVELCMRPSNYETKLFWANWTMEFEVDIRGEFTHRKLKTEKNRYNFNDRIAMQSSSSNISAVILDCINLIFMHLVLSLRKNCVMTMIDSGLRNMVLDGSNVQCHQHHRDTTIGSTHHGKWNEMPMDKSVAAACDAAMQRNNVTS